MGQNSRVKQLSDLTLRFQNGELSLEEYRAAKASLPDAGAPPKAIRPEDSRVKALTEKFRDGELTMAQYSAEKNKLLSYESTQPQDKEMKHWRWILYAAIGVPVLLFGGCAALIKFSPESEPTPVDPTVQAGQICENKVKGMLKAPATAEFSGWKLGTVGENSWIVGGVVDSENSFGATIRTSFSCSVSLTGTTWKSEVLYLE